MLELERRNQPYLLRLRQTANVQRLVACDWSRADNQGCQMAEDWCSCMAGARSAGGDVRQRLRGGIAARGA
ncbi:MAG: hypothetical protein IPF55_21305 [Rhodoferax sp.]|nr:hypothetical protein [Rhodoferax sp.]